MVARKQDGVQEPCDIPVRLRPDIVIAPDKISLAPDAKRQRGNAQPAVGHHQPGAEVLDAAAGFHTKSAGGKIATDHTRAGERAIPLMMALRVGQPLHRRTARSQVCIDLRAPSGVDDRVPAAVDEQDRCAGRPRIGKAHDAGRVERDVGGKPRPPRRVALVHLGMRDVGRCNATIGKSD